MPGVSAAAAAAAARTARVAAAPAAWSAADTPRSEPHLGRTCFSCNEAAAKLFTPAPTHTVEGYFGYLHFLDKHHAKALVVH